MRVLAITRIFPNAAEPQSAPFNRQQLAALGRRCPVEVIATLPWFPGVGLASRWSAAASLVRVPRREQIAGLPVAHPRALYLPRLPGAAAGLYAASLLPDVLARRGHVDVVLGTWAYPDGCAAVLLAGLLGVPAVVKLHGSDMNVIARLRGPRVQLRALLPRAARVVAVSRALAAEAEELGVAPDRIRLVRNGVDGERFHPADRAAARAELGLASGRRLALYVGHLKENKGVLDLAAAMAEVAEADLVVVGGGEAAGRLEAALAPLGARARLIGERPHEEVSRWMAAADVVVLPSWNEGTPNAVIEALACGRRVVATRVGGTPDLITSDLLGSLVAPKDPAALADALRRALATDYDPEAVARAASASSWDDSAAKLHAVLEEAVREAR
jgi:glycosyltransferase involved in cell wall biosynthesis